MTDTPKHPLKRQPTLSASRPSTALKAAETKPRVDVLAENGKRYSFQLSDAHIKKIRMMAAARGVPQSIIISELVEAAVVPEFQ